MIRRGWQSPPLKDSREVSAAASMESFYCTLGFRGQGSVTLDLEGILMPAAEYPPYLSNPPLERTVTALCVGGNKGPHGGVIIKFALQGTGKTETLTFLRAAGASLGQAIDLAGQQGYLRRLTDAERALLVAAMPKLEDYDWNLQRQKSRIVHKIEVLSIPAGFSFAFLMKDHHTRRQFLIPLNLVQFLGEYLYAYRECLDDPKTNN